MKTLDAIVSEQLDAVDLAPDHPLIICDVDEVVVHFLRGLERHLETNGYWLDAISFALNGNIRSKATNEAADTETVGRLLYGYFDDHVAHMDVIEDAVTSLKSLEAHADIIMLTNLPPRYLEARIGNLSGHGLDYPVIANIGAKGPTVDAMLAGHRETVVFVDDSPSNIASVAQHTPHVDLVHFMQDDRFAQVAPSAADVLLRTDNWNHARTVIESHLSRPGDQTPTTQTA